MQKGRALIAACKPPLTAALFGAFLFTNNPAISDPREPTATDTGTSAPASCDPQNVVVYQADESPQSNVACSSETEVTTVDRDYLIATATPGTTMVRQGPALAVGRLHPEFVRRLAAAIREARQAGLATAGIFSAYRPPAFGVGGFSDKFNSLHTYGLAVDMTGIGGPGSSEARQWHEIAAQHGVACPYGAQNRLEWNHCQPTRVRIVLPENPLRVTVTASGPIDLGNMFEAGDSLIESRESVAEGMNGDAAAPVAPVLAGPALAALARALAERRLGAQALARADADDDAGQRPLHQRSDRTRTGRAGFRAAAAKRCRKLLQGGKDACGTRRVETAARAQALHRRQVAASTARNPT